MARRSPWGGVAFATMIILALEVGAQALGLALTFRPELAVFAGGFFWAGWRCREETDQAPRQRLESRP